MTNNLKQKIERQLAEMESLPPPKNGFVDYKEFLKKHHLVLAFSFNEPFLLNLIDLACNCYINKIRYNKRLLFRILKSYYYKKGKTIHLSKEVVDKLFFIFENEISIKGQILETINYLLIGQKLNDKHLIVL